MDRRTILERIRQRYRKAFAIVATCLLLLPALAQANLQLGGFSFAYSPAKPLDVPTHLSKGLKSYGFVSGVGGVAFGAVATPAGNLEVIDLEYDPARPDGERLLVRIREGNGEPQVVVAPVADWIMLPIARFAAGDQHAIFTLFGSLRDEEEGQKWLEKEARILNYHPAIMDTLLGLRLFQADILAFHPASVDLPGENGSYLLGAGEQAPAPADFLTRLASQQLIQKMYGESGARSYVICDHEQEIKFSVAEKRLQLSGFPYWAAWKLNKDQEAILDDFLAKHGNEIMDMQEALSKFQEHVSANNLVSMQELSQKFSAKMRELQGGNPQVYAALTSAMRYSAFFRHVKAQSAQKYSAFVKSLAKAPVLPAVATPTVFIPPQHAS